MNGSDLTISLKKSLYKSSEDKPSKVKKYVAEMAQNKESSEASISYTKKFSGLTAETDHKGLSYAKLVLNYTMTDTLSFNATSKKYIANDISGIGRRIDAFA